MGQVKLSILVTIYSITLKLYRFVHNTQAECMWVETFRSCMDHWYKFFIELEASYGLDYNNSAHIWLLQHLFLSIIDTDALQWVDW